MYLNYLADGKAVSEQTAVVFDEVTDICVVGLGTSGSLAAIAAAEAGASVVGIEKLNVMGGVSTAGCVWDYYYGAPGGRFEGINAECFQMMNGSYASSDRYQNKRSIAGVVKSLVLEQTAFKANCKLYYETTVIGVYLDGNRVIGVQTFDGEVRKNIKAKVVIDSADGLICKMAGCNFMKGRAYDGQTMKFSKTIGIEHNGYIKGVWTACDFIDGDNALALSKKIMLAGSKPPCLKESYTESDRVLFEGAIIGVREVLCVETEQPYTLEDYVANRPVPKPLFYGFAPLDNTNHDIAYENEVQQDWRFISSLYQYGLSVAVPFGALIPKNIGGLLVSGKAIGMGHDLISCIRMKSNLEKCGEAAGIIGYLAAKNNIEPLNVCYEELKEYLVKSGCLDSKHHIGIGDLTQAEGAMWKAVKLPQSESEFKRILSTERPGLALWSLRQFHGERMAPKLIEWLDSPDERLKQHSAIGLGLIGRTEACAPLREILSNPPMVWENHERPHHYTNYAKAICLLGRLDDVNAVELLQEIVRDGGRKAASTLKTDSFYPTTETYAIQFSSLAQVALEKILTNTSR